MPRCLVGVDGKSRKKREQWNCGCKGARQLEPGRNWRREDLVQGSCVLTDPASLSEEDLSCWNGAERRPPVQAQEWMAVSFGSQGSYRRKAVGWLEPGGHVIFLSFAEGRCA